MNIRNKILFNLGVCPGTVGPGALGLSAFILSWAFGGIALFNMVGMMGLLAAIGVGITNMTWNYESAKDEIINKLRKQQEDAQQAELERFYMSLHGERERKCFIQLRKAYNAFMADLRADKLNETITPEIPLQIKNWVEACQRMLERINSLYDDIARSNGKVKKAATARRDELVEEVEQNVEELDQTVVRMKDLDFQTETGNLDKLRQNIAQRLSIAAKVNEQIDSENMGQDERIRQLMNEYGRKEKT